MIHTSETFETVLTDKKAIQKMYINGEWVESSSGRTREILNPANNAVIATVTEGGADEADRAVQAAKNAFYKDGWKTAYARTRADLLLKVSRKLEEQKEEIAKLETLNNGKLYSDSLVDVEDAIHQFQYYAGLAMQPHGQTYEVPDEIQAMVIREPIGVVAQIVPWNFPLVMAAQKMSAALAAGCTVVVKPATQTPLTLIRLFEIIDEAGFPKGVANLVLGSGSTVGNALVTHRDVDKISFTGGTSTGKQIMKDAAETVKKVGLELGGKSPNIVFADADFETAVDYALLAIFAGQGQVCSAGSRLILEKSIYDKFVPELVARAKNIKVGPGWKETSEMGPLISRDHMETVLHYIQIGKEEGASLLCGGTQLIEGELANGNYVAPTIFTDTAPTMRIVQEEIFGPVLVIQVFETEEEAVELANGTDFGLAAAVFTNDGAKAQRVIRGLQAGITWVNTYHPTFNEAPWSGYKQSGIGGDLGTYGFEEYLYKKQVNIALQVQPSGVYKG
ncbi:aldehyde dehydrogenase family protein [Bacillus inaquosorum]|uniref:aldehyde dehydrogenase family protein n=1 Tax=Bacillus inaquosorum TaxID=483913 RepID=UPI002DFF5F80|nr:aldehyde dehydrogenase family protein [Bacillus inaquosorum]MEC5228719.1 aldehyde dehydrogenase family protein [Bacillus inaquosorum]MED1196495.1 aldehyde dehydrogenase family protein [Bacillus inaquosorum]MED1222775.1 aldehyde dehydrogenase family protein [Bacillus inaquosorum]